MSAAPPLPKWAPVAVQWLDADTCYHSARSTEFEGRWKRHIRWTIGWLIQRDRERIVVAMDDDRLCQTGEDDCETVTTIPAGMVLKVVVLKPARRSAPKKRA